MPTPTTPTTPTRRRTREENAASLRRAAASVMPGIALVLRDDVQKAQTAQEFEAALAKFLAAAQAKVDARFAESDQGGRLLLERGPKYIRVVCATGIGKDPSQYTHRSAYCFVDREEGKVWKCAGWKAPERKNPRSCIYDADHGASGVTGYGVNYLR